MNRLYHMSFETHKIRKINWNKKKKQALSSSKSIIQKLSELFSKILSISKPSKKNFLFLIVFLGIFFGAYASYKVLTIASDLSLKEITLSIFSQKIKTDEFNHTNFLLTGIGGENHDGGDLTDTIKIVSIDHTNKYITMLSLPRDLWIKSEYGGSRINELYQFKKEETDSESQGMEFLKQEISKITGLTINYAIKIDFKTFEQAVDSLGCIHINIPESIYDPTYPKDGTYLYEPFKINAGEQCIDGETALKYARSRHTTKGGDFGRSQRQSLILKAIKDEAMSAGVLLSPKKLNNLYGTFKDNVYTDLTWDELVYLAKISSKFDSNNILSVSLNDVPYSEGGFLYTPPREEFAGASVLLPSYRKQNSDTYTEIKKFIKLFFYKTELYKQKTPLHILNGTKIPGLASDTLYMLSRYGFNVVRYGNALNRDGLENAIYIKPQYDDKGNMQNDNIEKNDTVNLLKDFLPITQSQMTTNTEYDSASFETEAEYIIVLGQDFTNYMKENRELFYYWE